MKIQKLMFLIILIISIMHFQVLYAFENVKTHPVLTGRAVIASTIDDYLKNQIGLANGIATELSYDFPFEIKSRIERAKFNGEITTRTLFEWLKVGSAIEDTDLYPVKPRRPRHHFYDPTRNAGLNNRDDNPNYHGGPEFAMDFKGGSALTWAVDGNAPYAPTTNKQSWHNARTDFYNSLTQSVKSDREKYLAMTFLDLGCVLHMLEDMGVPAHTRNDFLFAHYRKYNDYGNPLEDWIERKISEDNNSLTRWISSGWTPTPQIFSKVSNYFDSDLYTGSYLGDGVPTPGTWGLSESSNYQFLSWTTIFSQDTNSLYYFPHPAKMHTAEVNESGRIYLTGYGVDHLARKTMSYHHLKHEHLDKSWCVLGATIYDDYATITLPRTIDYATGLANYFFRGKLNIQLNYLTCDEIRLNITNVSQNSGIGQYFKNGMFVLYWDEPNGLRTEVAEFVAFDSNNPADNDIWDSGSVLAYGDSIRAEFPKPAGAVEKFILVYKGNICENPSELDTDDSEALATAIIVNPGCPFAANDCGCFLDPATPVWNNSTTYNTGNLVEYNGDTYKSNADNNIDHIPYENPAWWTKVSNTVSSGNENWDAYPPFGGPGKSPKYLKATFYGITRDDPFWQCQDESPGVDCGLYQQNSTPNHQFILTHISGCYWKCSPSRYPGWYVAINLNHYIKLESIFTESFDKSCHYFTAGEGGDINGGYGDTHYWCGNNVEYKIGNLASNWQNENQYYCKQDHASSDNTEPGYGSNWTNYWEVVQHFKYFEEPIKNFCCLTEVCEMPWWGNDRDGYVIMEPITIIAFPTWILDHNYNEGDIVISSDSEKYVCNISHTSALNTKPVIGTNWQSYWSLITECCGE